MSFADLTPHGFCLAWEPGLIWLQAVSDTLISLAYFSIPAVLVIFARRRSDLAFRPVFGLFAAFIVACGATHVMGVVTLWLPAYWLDGAIKAVAAALSLATAILLWPLLPRALALPSPGQLHRLNLELARQVEERDAATSRPCMPAARPFCTPWMPMARCRKSATAGWRRSAMAAPRWSATT
jgi:hypothetical protein